ncbi:MAG: ABC transporter ATP-binding protein [Candidatus Latescibacteria bacterium]|nr:ABC transporter ATP-binding protein [bacterium]MCB9514738.1 ABC transporter ATP-binding protein [Candidatus Latescibacterota bacterium]
MLRVRGLRVEHAGHRPPLALVDGVDLALDAGETVCLVGESGCGKSLSALSLPGLLPAGLRRRSESLRWRGREIGALDERALRRLRGAEIGVVFQEPMTSLNPVLRVATQIGEVLREHRGLGRREARARAEQLLAEVGVPAPGARLDSYPHELSGGLRQRVMIAMALACDPALLIADEPTTALDVSLQAQVLALLAGLRERRGLALLFITHDLGVVAALGGRVMVMYAGQVVETGPAATLLAAPAHPYTRALLASLPRVDRRVAMAGIPGSVPPAGRAPAGCRFRDRCGLARPGCERPQTLTPLDAEGSLSARCWLAAEGAP